MDKRVLRSLLSRGLRVIAQAPVLLVLILAIAPICAVPAWADEDSSQAQASPALNPGGVTMVDTLIGGVPSGKWNWGERDYSSVNPQSDVGLFPYVQLQFDKNVSYAQEGRDDSFLEENAKRLHLRYMDGTDVEGAEPYLFNTRESRQWLGIRTLQWLRPLTEYQVVVDPGIMAANGMDVTDQEYVVTFKTGPECEDGVNAYAKMAIALVIFAVVVGIAVSVVRQVCLRRR